MAEPNVGGSLPGTRREDKPATEAELLTYLRAVKGTNRPVAMSLAEARRLQGAGTAETAEEWYDAKRQREAAQATAPATGIAGVYKSLGGDKTKPPLEDFKNVLSGLGKKAAGSVSSLAGRVAENYDPRVKTGVQSVVANISGDPNAIRAADAASANAAAGLAPGAGGYFEDEERAGVAEAARLRGSAQAQAADPNAIAALLRGGQPRVVGMTAGGFQPSTRGESAQVESKVFPPEFKEALASMTAHGRSAAEGGSVVQGELASLASSAASQRSQALQQAALEEQTALESEERAKRAAEQRIQLAIQDFEQSAPRAENYGTLFAEQDAGGKVGGVIGSLLGIFGGALSGTPSKFTAQLDKQLERRAAAAEAASRVKGQVVGMAENAYARLERTLGNSAAARAAIRAIYAEQAKADMEAAAAQIGVAAEHPKLQEALAALEEKRLGYLREMASNVTQQARSDERYAPPRAIIAQGPRQGGMLEDLLGKDDKEDLRKFEKELEGRGILQGERAVNDMLSGIEEMKKEDPDAARRLGLVLSANNPESWGNLYGQFASTPGSQKFFGGYLNYINNFGGKAVTKSEGIRIGGVLGSGGNEALQTAAGIFARPVVDGYRSLQSGGWQRSARNYALLREANRAAGRGPFDFTKVDTPETRQEPLPVQR